MNKKMIFMLFVLCGMMTSPYTYADRVIRVLVLYPQWLKNSLNDTALNSMINTRIDWANQAFSSSGSDVSLKLLGHQVYNADHNEEVSQALLDGLVLDEGHMALRDAYKPTVTVYLTKGTPSANSILCGKAFFPQHSSTRRGVKIYDPEAAFYGVSAVAYDCASYVLAHEVGHNMGMAHSKKQGDSGTPIPESRGWGVDYSFVTVVAYSSAFGNAPKSSARVYLFSISAISNFSGVA